MLYEYQKMRDENMRERERQQHLAGPGDSPTHSKKAKDKKRSVVCVVM